MSPSWPTVAEEQALAAQQPAPWRRVSVALQIVFFFLTIGGVAAMSWLYDLLRLPQGWITLAVSLLLAEILIRRYRFWRTGVESALWIGGLFAFIVSLQSTGKPEAIMLFAAAAALAGWRVRNALFGGLALILIFAYLLARDWQWGAVSFALGAASVALFALTRMWRRPSTEMLWQLLVVIMPVAAYTAVKADRSGRAGVIALFAGMAVLFLLGAIRYRMRVLFLATAVAFSIAAIEALTLIPWSIEWKLILAGAFALGLAAAIMRVLRGKERGFVLDAQKSETEEALQIAAMLAMTAPATPPARPTPTGGGEFGGAGASGNF